MGCYCVGLSCKVLFGIGYGVFSVFSTYFGENTELSDLPFFRVSVTESIYLRELSIK